MKYRQIVTKLKNALMEDFNIQEVSLSLTRYRSGGGGSILDVTTWSDKDPNHSTVGEYVETFIDSSSVEDLFNLSVYVYARENKSNYQWKHYHTMKQVPQ